MRHCFLFLLFVDLHDVVVVERPRGLGLEVEALGPRLHLLGGLAVETEAVGVKGRSDQILESRSKVKKSVG